MKQRFSAIFVLFYDKISYCKFKSQRLSFHMPILLNSTRKTAVSLSKKAYEFVGYMPILGITDAYDR